MVEADLTVASVNQLPGNRLRLLVALGRPRQGSFIDLALVGLERRHMGVAENRKTIRLEPQRLFDCVEARPYRLEWKAVDEVEIDFLDPALAKQPDGPGGGFYTLLAVDCSLDLRVEALHAEARTVNKGSSESGRELGGKGPWIY